MTSPACECGCPAYRHNLDGPCRGSKADPCPCLEYRPIPKPGVCHCSHVLRSHAKREPHACQREYCTCTSYVDQRQVLLELPARVAPRKKAHA